MSRVLSNRYAIGPLIGSGGSARVYEARDQVLDRRVAVKMLDSHAAASNDPANRERFLGEAKSAARFNHPGAVAVFDAGDSDGDLFIVMELVDGVSVAYLIASEAPMPEAAVVRIGTQLLAALAAAHSAGLVHRDVKPANVLVDKHGKVKLADFGIAKRFDELADSLTTHGMVVGSRHYLAPEQAAGRPITPAADQYAVGVLLYEMLTGKRPPAASTTDGVGPDVRDVRPDVSAPVAQAISRALAPCPDQRYPSVTEMAADLRVEDTPTTVLPTDRRPAPGPAVTTVAAAPPAARSATMVLPAAEPRPVTTVHLLPPEPAPRRPWWMLALVVVLATGAVGLVLAARGPAGAPSSDAPPADASALDPGASEPATAGAVFDPDAVLPLPTIAPGTELIPGFPATDDVDEFIEQLREGREVAGKRSKKLGDELRKVLDADDDRRGEMAADLAEELEEWIDEGEIDPAVADRALVFLALHAGA